MGQGVSGYDMKTYEGKSYAVEQTTEHSIGLTGTPNSVLQKYNEDDELEKERYYDDDGKAYVDIDYTDHGNPKEHRKCRISMNGIGAQNRQGGEKHND